jgi:xylulose-5-phosphate/fructose-6-phosphate phosphoketolase
VLARIPRSELVSLLEGYGHQPWFVEGSDPEEMHQLMAATIDEVVAEISRIHESARKGHVTARPRWPMIVLITPKGWTGPKQVDGMPAEGSFRSHQVPLADLAEKPEHLAQLESWMRSYRPEQLFDDRGALQLELRKLAPSGERRMSANPHSNGGLLLHKLELPDFRNYAVDVPTPATTSSEATRVLGVFLRDVIDRNPTTSASSAQTRRPRIA